MSIPRVRKSSRDTVYIALFACFASSRAVHLDLVPDLSTETFLRCLKRFISRRGMPRLVVSHNGKTFKGSSFKAFPSLHRISWQFNDPHASWWGGIFERMKRRLKKTLGNARISYEDFKTVLIEVEGILNSRPLTYLYQDLEEPLARASLYIGRRFLSPSPRSQGATRPAAVSVLLIWR